MNFIKQNRGKISAVFVIFVLLFVAYFSCGTPKIDNNEPVETGEFIDANIENEESNQEEILPEQESKTIEDKEIEKAESEENSELFCTLSVRCDTILSDISQFDAEKIDILPKDGVIFAERKVAFSDGESVFDLLLREMKNNKIHLEFVNTPVYGSVYIEGIGNIYEFDAGELSGWMYRVNGEFPNFGCSKYILKQGDKVEFVYTCDLGKDVGGGYVKGQGAYDE